MKKTIIMLTVLALFAGCANQGTTELVPINKTVSCSAPYMLYEGSCCLDSDSNDRCDYLEKKETTTTTETTQVTQTTVTGKTTTTTLDPCANNIKDAGETGVDCGGGCPECKDPCETLIKDSIIKPAARTTKICLSTNAEMTYGQYNLSIEKRIDVILVNAVDANGSMTESELSRENDAIIGNVVIRLIGSAKNGSITYAEVYAWTLEGGIKCSTHADCGPDQPGRNVCLNGQKIISQYLTYRCSSPGTVQSSCQATQKQEDVETCIGNQVCVQGEDKCFHEQCYNDIRDRDETSTDCGGSCRPCHCFNERKDSDETNVDCGGGCVPCIVTIEEDNKAPWVRILSPQNKTYSTDRINLSVSVNEEANCSYALNEGQRMNMNRLNLTLFAQRGTNHIIVYCSDKAGNFNQSRQTFGVSLKRSQACQQESVSNDYTGYFDSAIYMRDNELELGAADTCTQEVFDYALSYIPDSGRHENEADSSVGMRDKNLTDVMDASLSYECANSGRLRIGYLRLDEAGMAGANKAAALIYFTERYSPGVSGYWRIYSYTGDEVKLDSYIDLPYRPNASVCGTNVMYQELDVTPLLDANQESLSLRIGLYSSSINTQVAVKEIELSRS